jgi:starch phosphorylase
VNDEDFKDRWRKVKYASKERLAAWVEKEMGVVLNPDQQIFDVQVKRIHEYKRQALNIFSVIDRYLQIIDGNGGQLHPRATLIGGKAAPGYFFAKRLIKLINNVARVINSDERVGDRLKCLYIPNYNVTLAEMIIPAADINQQISTAGTEASGTSNMKFAFNSSIIVGTRDGANIEIGEAGGEENVFFFGALADQVDELRRTASQRGLNPRLQRVFDAIKSGVFGDAREYECIWQSVENGDHYLVNYDFEDYLRAQRQVDQAYGDSGEWVKKCITVMANMGKFSSDRTITEYANEIWHIKPYPLGTVSEDGAIVQRANVAEVGSLRRHQHAAMLASKVVGGGAKAPVPVKGGFGSLPRGVGHANPVGREIPRPPQKQEELEDNEDGDDNQKFAIEDSW